VVGLNGGRDPSWDGRVRGGGRYERINTLRGRAVLKKMS